MIHFTRDEHGWYIGWERPIGPYTTLTNFTHWRTLLLHPIRELRYLTGYTPEALVKARLEA